MIHIVKFPCIFLHFFLFFQILLDQTLIIDHEIEKLKISVQSAIGTNFFYFKFLLFDFSFFILTFNVWFSFFWFYFSFFKFSLFASYHISLKNIYYTTYLIKLRFQNGSRFRFRSKYFQTVFRFSYTETNGRQRGQIITIYYLFFA